MIEGPTTSEETKITRAITVAVIIIVAMITGCVYRQDVVMPMQMAEKGYCLQPYPGMQSWSYQPCKTPPAEAK